MLRLIDTLLETLSDEEKEILERKCRIALSRPRKRFITGTKDRAKRLTRINAWTFLSEYYGIVFRAPMYDQLNSLAPLIQDEHPGTLPHMKRKREHTLSTNDQPVPKKSCLSDDETSYPVNATGRCTEEDSNDWLKGFLDDTTLSSSSSSSNELGQSSSDTMHVSDELISTSSSTGNTLSAPIHTTAQQDPCLLLGLYELFKYKRDLFDKLCAELNI